jgi:hypothetical protein
MVTTDQVTGTMYLEDGGGGTWKWNGTSFARVAGSGGPIDCNGSANLYFDQIAAKNGTLYGMQSDAVWSWSSGSCWSQVGTKANIYSIATDNCGNTAVSHGGTSCTAGPGIWATDANGDIYYAN